MSKGLSGWEHGRMRSRIFGLLAVFALTVAAASCSKSSAGNETSVQKTTAETTAETAQDTAQETAAASAVPVTEIEPPESVPAVTDSTAALRPARFPDDSPTCVAVAKVRNLNDQAGALTSKFQEKILATMSDDSPDKGAIDKGFDEFVKEFNAKTVPVQSELLDAYAVLSKEQPQFADDLTNLSEVTVAVLGALGTLQAGGLDNFEELLLNAAPQDNIIAAGQASLKIDAFTKAACDLPFANT